MVTISILGVESSLPPPYIQLHGLWLQRWQTVSDDQEQTDILWSNASDCITELIAFWASFCETRVFYRPQLQPSLWNIDSPRNRPRSQAKLWMDFRSTWCYEGLRNSPDFGGLHRPSKRVYFLKSCRQHVGSASSWASVPISSTTCIVVVNRGVLTLLSVYHKCNIPTSSVVRPVTTGPVFLCKVSGTKWSLCVSCSVMSDSLQSPGL